MKKIVALCALFLLLLMGCAGTEINPPEIAPSEAVTPITPPMVPETAERTAVPTKKVSKSPATTPAPTKPRPTRTRTSTTEPHSIRYASCAEARRAGAAPLHRGDPGYRSGLDRDGDGTACE